MSINRGFHRRNKANNVLQIREQFVGLIYMKQFASYTYRKLLAIEGQSCTAYIDL